MVAWGRDCTARTLRGLQGMSMLATLLALMFAAGGAQRPEAPTWVEVVTGDADPAQPLPLVVVLHGRGGNAEAMTSIARGLGTPARVILPRGPLPEARGRAWFQPRLRSDEGPLVEAVQAASDELSDLLEDVRRLRPSCGRTTFVGFSQGGALGLAYAADHPDEVALVVPMGAWVPPALQPGPAVPVTALHGTQDHNVPIRWVRAMVEQLQAAGGRARLIAHRGVSHQTTPRMRRQARQAVRAALAEEWTSACAET